MKKILQKQLILFLCFYLLIILCSVSCDSYADYFRVSSVKVSLNTDPYYFNQPNNPRPNSGDTLRSYRQQFEITTAVTFMACKPSSTKFTNDLYAWQYYAYDQTGFLEDSTRFYTDQPLVFEGRRVAAFQNLLPLPDTAPFAPDAFPLKPVNGRLPAGNRNGGYINRQQITVNKELLQALNNKLCTFYFEWQTAEGAVFRDSVTAFVEVD